ncbi:MAG: hypothetical protein EKK55_22685 [Rhodocyclaceae bacterium]|nr:MAG: hypothetical protein EKK55_22685 [Rhodocyclaceae bacterium]
MSEKKLNPEEVGILFHMFRAGVADPGLTMGEVGAAARLYSGLTGEPFAEVSERFLRWWEGARAKKSKREAMVTAITRLLDDD